MHKALGNFEFRAYIWVMNNSLHFSHGKISRINVARVPISDLASLKLDRNPEAAHENETSVEHIPLFVQYNDEEDWYWRYGEERLYKQVFSGEQNPQSDQISWDQLHCFVTNFAWVDPKWRFLLDKPCWPLHIDVVDLVVMLYHGRKSYEQNQDNSTPREMMDLLDLSKRLSEEVQTSLRYCKLETGEKGGETYRWVYHTCDESTRVWIRSMLHRVVEFKDSPLPPSPILRTAFNLSRFNNLEDGTGAKAKHT